MEDEVIVLEGFVAAQRLTEQPKQQRFSIPELRKTGNEEGFVAAVQRAQGEAS